MNRPLQDKSFAFAVRVVRLARHLQQEQREFILSRQLLRSGTAVGALVRESAQAESRSDFVHKLAIALKEANETAYWLELLHEAEYINATAFRSIYDDCTELLKLLTAILKTTKSTM